MAAVGQLTKDGRGSSSLWRLLAGNRLAALPHHVLDRAKKGGVSLGSLRVGSQETGLVGVVMINKFLCDEAPVVALHGEKGFVRPLVPLWRPVFQWHHQPALRIALDPLLDDLPPGIPAVLSSSIFVQDRYVGDHETLGWQGAGDLARTPAVL